MATPILVTKLYIPPPRLKIVLRPRLIERLNEGLSGESRLTIISAPAGFGKTTLVSAWVASCRLPVAWLSLDEGDSDPARLLTYLVGALQGITAHIGEGVLALLDAASPQLPPTQSILTALLNEISAIPDDFILVLDDYHLVDSQPVDLALTFLLEHLPPRMHLVIATREDPNLPLARWRARGQLTELRVADLRFTPAEAADFLNQVMGLNLLAEDIAALETHTEGWVAGLQLAALSMRGHADIPGFIQSFTGSHHFVMDYLVEEVLQQQSASIQAFLLRTSILDRLCGPLCDAVLLDPTLSGQATLEFLERANLFIVPLDNERRWYRYHRLFADLLRQRLQQSLKKAASPGRAPGEDEVEIAEYHRRASAWYEENGYDFEAFQHAAAANDVERAERLIEGKGMPLHFRGATTAILDWLASLPAPVLDARPSLRVRYATMLLVTGQRTGVEEKLQAAEAALTASLRGAELDARTRNLFGQIAAARATVALTQYQPEAMLAQSRRALEFLPPDNLIFRSTAYWTMAFAYQLQGDRAAASQAYSECASISQAAGNTFNLILAISGLGLIQEFENQLYAAAETYRRVLRLFGEQPLPNACEVYLGLARISYEWNDLDAAEEHAQQSLVLARQFDPGIDRFVISQVFLARLKMARGDLAGAEAILSGAEQATRQNNFVYRMPEVAAGQVLLLLRQGNLSEAARLAQTCDLPVIQARVHLAQADPAAALALLEPLRRQMEIRRWEDERLKVMVLQAVALRVLDEKDQAGQVLDDALALAEPGGFVRIFIDEGLPMAELLSEAVNRGRAKEYARKLLAAFDAEEFKNKEESDFPHAQPLFEGLSQRELEVLRLIAEGLSNQEISQRLFLALNTVKGHNRIIFDKLQVQSRTEAVARARQLGLL
jgi:LuxR family transcriptional regulator, maltose regulon positive regulatory protein